MDKQTTGYPLSTATRHKDMATVERIDQMVDDLNARRYVAGAVNQIIAGLAAGGYFNKEI